MTPLQQALREAMLASVARFPPEAPLLLSGGADSATVLAALLACGRRPECFTFQVGQHESRDLAVARQMATAFGLRHQVVSLPRAEPQLRHDIREVLAAIRTPTKVHVQCGHAFLYLSRAVHASGHRLALFAMSGDDLLGTERATAVCLHQQGEAAARRLRLDNFTTPGLSDWSVQRVAVRQGVFLADPFRAPAVASRLLQASMAELHQGFEKSAIVGAFPEFWRRGRWYRHRESLQVVSGLRELHDTLLNSAAVNVRGSKAVLALYHDMLKDLERGGTQRRRSLRVPHLRCAWDDAAGVVVEAAMPLAQGRVVLDFADAGPVVDALPPEAATTEWAVPAADGRQIVAFDSPYRFIGHSPDPSCALVGTRLVALHPIPAGGRITLDRGRASAHA